MWKGQDSSGKTMVRSIRPFVNNNASAGAAGACERLEQHSVGQFALADLVSLLWDYYQGVCIDECYQV